MQKQVRVLATLLLTIAVMYAQGFKIYPGATKYTPPDTTETREMQKLIPPGTEGSHYTTNDSFEKVVAFYKGLGQEYTMPDRMRMHKLPNGTEVKQVYFIFDGAKDLRSSKSWAQVQRPFILSIGKDMQPQDVRDITVINLTQKK